MSVHYDKMSTEDRKRVLHRGLVARILEATNRLADAFGFSMLDARGFEAGAKYLLSRGYR